MTDRIRSKADVTFHSDQGVAYQPMVNVKVPYTFTEDARRFAEAEIGFEDERAAFLMAYSEFGDPEGVWFGAACEVAWEDLQGEAEEVFGVSTSQSAGQVKVWSAGRSGGWAYVDGLPDFDSWDAIMLGKWARFAKLARALADDVPYNMASLYYYNVFEGEYDAHEPKRRMLVGSGVGL